MEDRHAHASTIEECGKAVKASDRHDHDGTATLPPPATPTGGRNPVIRDKQQTKPLPDKKTTNPHPQPTTQTKQKHHTNNPKPHKTPSIHPTHVGMNPIGGHGGPRLRYPPHTRGDEPGGGIRGTSGGRSTPHTWG